MRPLIDAGYVYIAQPPLYSTIIGKEKIYLKDDAREGRVPRRSNPDHKHEFIRLKGLGEMDYEELNETTMDATKRTLLQGRRSTRRRRPTRSSSMLMGETSRRARTSSSRTPKTSVSWTSKDRVESEPRA